MKAITLWQPWASLIACGAKKFETRSWETNYRGPIAIHAASKSIKSILKECFPLGEWSYHPSYEAKSRFLNAVGFALMTPIDTLPLGSIVAIAELVGCYKIYDTVDNGVHIVKCPDTSYNFDKVEFIRGNEILFGDWTKGRFAWEFSKMSMFPEPIPAKGKQGLWNWEYEKDYTQCPYWRNDKCMGFNCCDESGCPHAPEYQPWLKEREKNESF